MRLLLPLMAALIGQTALCVPLSVPATIATAAHGSARRGLARRQTTTSDAAGADAATSRPGFWDKAAWPLVSAATFVAGVGVERLRKNGAAIDELRAGQRVVRAVQDQQTAKLYGMAGEQASLASQISLLEVAQHRTAARRLGSAMRRNPRFRTCFEHELVPYFSNEVVLSALFVMPHFAYTICGLASALVRQRL
jgi:hypothetical protein